MTDVHVRHVSRRLRNLCEPIAACVYFAPEAISAYEELGLDYAQGYFTSRSACMGQLSGEAVTATFGVFRPEVVVPSVREGWSKTDPDTLLQARYEGATAALERMIGTPDTARAVEILRPAMEAQPLSGRPIFAGLRSLPFPDEPLGALWRACDYVREHRGDGHVAAWIATGLDALEIGLLTEIYWGLDVGSYIATRGFGSDDVEKGLRRLEEHRLVADGRFTEAGRALREGIEDATDSMEAGVVEALGDAADELFGILEPWTQAILDAGGYPVDPARVMDQVRG